MKFTLNDLYLNALLAGLPERFISYIDQVFIASEKPVAEDVALLSYDSMLEINHDRPTGHLQPQCKRQPLNPRFKTPTLKPSMLVLSDRAVDLARNIRALGVVVLPTGLLTAQFQQERGTRRSSGREGEIGRKRRRRRKGMWTRSWLLVARSVLVLWSMD